MLETNNFHRNIRQILIFPGRKRFQICARRYSGDQIQSISDKKMSNLGCNANIHFSKTPSLILKTTNLGFQKSYHSSKKCQFLGTKWPIIAKHCFKNQFPLALSYTNVLVLCTRIK